MAIFVNGKAIHPFINGKRIATIYRGGSLIYRDYTKPGTVLASPNAWYVTKANISFFGAYGGYNAIAGEDGINIGVKANQLKTGIIIYPIDTVLYIEYNVTDSNGYVHGYGPSASLLNAPYYQNPIYITKDKLNSNATSVFAGLGNESALSVSMTGTTVKLYTPSVSEMMIFKYSQTEYYSGVSKIAAY
ncbi:hypothetical protein MUDAN_BIHEEGNE_02226 [Lactiplantibacillus mudanjiangensis]|uniref:hypothetical protein n=1 Tax=Lactiplantibacillus mudanjiangensis TaxID=1296538 RepID=UPI0010146B39|nr:hypothetical protein MUDAN_BIHEEGNE_02226 [Lactiplantibacillus mudanjiangensis]